MEREFILELFLQSNKLNRLTLTGKKDNIISGTLEGGRKAAATNKKRYGKGFYNKIGAIGGSRGRTGGFYADKDRARKIGKVGGRRSKRGHRLIKETPTKLVYQRLDDGSIVEFDKAKVDAGKA